MKQQMGFFGFLIMLAALVAGCAEERNNLKLVGWGIDEKNLESFMVQAEAVGFDELITWSNDPVFLAKAVAGAGPHGIKVVSCLAPMDQLGRLWAARYPERPVPWQVVTVEEEAALQFIMAGRNRFLIPYQFGGEPMLTHEVLFTKIICFNDPEARELFEPLIDDIAAVPDLAGIAFDGFGYQNYHGCGCERCQRGLADYRQAHPELTAEAAEAIFFRETLVNYINYLADYARSRRQDMTTGIHIWPVYAPEPLYGNRLDVDYCGQTAAWYMLWPQEKIASYSRIITEEAQKYYPRQQGAGMIGYYDRPGEFPVKDAARVDMELRTMIENGCRIVQVCGTSDVLGNREIAAVFKRYFK